MKTHIKQHKALFILPLGLLPFVILIFYILGGGSGQEEKTSHHDGGLNYQLPDADRDIVILDKKEAYQQIKEQEPAKPITLNVDTTQAMTPLELTENVSDVNVNEVLLAHLKQQERLSREALQKTHSIAQPAKRAVTSTPSACQTKVFKSTNSARPIPASSLQTSKGTAIELDELNILLDDYERLSRQNDSLSQALQKTHAQRKQKPPQQASFEVHLNAGVSFEKTIPPASAIQAQVLEDTKVLNGNRVMLRLLSDAQINGLTIRKGTLIYGLCKTDNERLQLQVSSIPYRNSFMPVNMSAYDLDGIKGLYVPDNVNRKVYKDVAGDVNPSVLFPPIDNPLSYMGINAASDLSKTMVKRVRIKRVYLRRNTVLLLKNN